MAENLNHSNSITNLGSKGSLTLGGKANTNGNIYIIDSLQNSTHNLKPYSKLATPKQSSKVIDSEPMRALPLIRSNSKTFASRENTPDTSKIVTSKPLMILNPNATPTYKEKKSFLQFGSLRGSKVGLSPLPADSLTGSKTKLRDLNDDLNAFQSVREPAVLKEVGQSKGGLDKPGFPTTKLTNSKHFQSRNIEEKPALFSQSAVQSRRSSKVTPLPILGMHSIETKNPNMMSSKKVGPNFSSLNVSAIEKGSGRNSHKPNLIHDTSLTSKEIISSSQTKKKPSSSALLIDNLRKFLEWSESQSSKFSLGELEKTNKIASNLLAEGKETYLIAKLKHPDESIDSLDKSLTVNSYTKGTMNYLRMRYKKEDEANVVIMEALSDELSRLTKIQNNLRDPE